MFPAKNLTVGQLAALRGAATRDGLRVVWAEGCFDWMHPGAAGCLAHARGLGHRLVVGVCPDGSARETRGPGRPFLPQARRAEVVAALACVDYVFLPRDPADRDLALRALAPDLRVDGSGEGRAPPEAAEGAWTAAPHAAGLSATRLASDLRRSDPERVLSAAFGLLSDPGGRLLLVRTRYAGGDAWGLPGGAQRRYEPLPEALRRELREETGLEAVETRFLGVLERVAPSRDRHLVAHLFGVRPAPGPGPEARPREDIVEVGWFDAARLASEPGRLMGRRAWLRYLADPAAWPGHVLLGEGDE